MARISDGRVKQFWDPKHLVAAALYETAKKHPPNPTPDCCLRKEFYWDDALVFAPHTHWQNQPPAEFWNGPVVRVIPTLEKTLSDSP